MQARCNDVRRTGAEYSGSVGIWGGYLIDGLVEGNTVRDTPYSGISVGWGWTWHPSCESARSPDAGLGCALWSKRPLAAAPEGRLSSMGACDGLGSPPRLERLSCCPAPGAAARRTTASTATWCARRCA